MFSLLALLQFIIPSLADIISLNGPNWTAISQNKSIKVTATVPGDIYLDLLRAGQLKDPYFRSNDMAERWVSKTNWTYRRSFEFGPSDAKIRGGKVQRLVFEGIDTIAAIYLNGQMLGNADNMFHYYAFDVSKILRQDGSNLLRVDFESPITAGKRLSEAYASKYKYTVPIDCPPADQQGECHVNFLRKMAASFSWDWGPAFPVMGLWHDVFVDSFDVCSLNPPKIAAVPIFSNSTNSWVVKVDFYLNCAVESVGSFSLALDGTKFRGESLENKLQSGDNVVKLTLDVPESGIERWWPNGLGGQKLYTVQAKAKVKGQNSDLSASASFGFRTINLIEKPVFVQNSKTQFGQTFYFEINGVATFIKGSNWIPGDAFQSRLTCNRLAYIFDSLKVTHANAIRVWGGGVYESDCFYDLADKAGVLIWQDFMFAVNLYPTNEDYLNSVKNEITYQVRRLKSHPSVLIWAGNNENELGIVGGWYHGTGTQNQYFKDYKTLYMDTMAPIVKAEDQSRPYVPSSPSNGEKSIKAGGIDMETSPNSEMYGDNHHYSYSADGWKAQSYPTTRCSTEYGFQSLPSMESLESALSRADLDFFGAELSRRQHHANGQSELVAQALFHFRIPSCEAVPGQWRWSGASGLKQLCGANTTLTSEKFLEIMVYFTQVGIFAAFLIFAM